MLFWASIRLVACSLFEDLPNSTFRMFPLPIEGFRSFGCLGSFGCFFSITGVFSLNGFVSFLVSFNDIMVVGCIMTCGPGCIPKFISLDSSR